MSNTEKTRLETNELRRVMGTLPDQYPPLITKFIKGVTDITVEMVDWPHNPYKAMYVLGTTCWGKKVNKWKETSPEARFLVVKAVLEKNALPLALEAPKFTFVIEGPSRACFDQIARTRVGVVFSARGMRDNNWKDASIRIPTCLWPDRLRSPYNPGLAKLLPVTDEELLFVKMTEGLLGTKEVYADIVDSGVGSWQAARTVLPLYVCYGWSESITYASLMGVCANRMKFCEMEDTVAVAWLLQKAVNDRFPLLGSKLKPGCDYAGRCQYHKSYTMSEMFGCLFKECGRNVCPDSNEYAEFNETCTNYNDLEEQLGIQITRPDKWPEYDSFDDLTESDKELFLED